MLPSISFGLFGLDFIYLFKIGSIALFKFYFNFQRTNEAIETVLLFTIVSQHKNLLSTNSFKSSLIFITANNSCCEDTISFQRLYPKTTVSPTESCCLNSTAPFPSLAACQSWGGKSKTKTQCHCLSSSYVAWLACKTTGKLTYVRLCTSNWLWSTRSATS